MNNVEFRATSSGFGIGVRVILIAVVAVVCEPVVIYAFLKSFLVRGIALSKSFWFDEMLGSLLLIFSRMFFKSDGGWLLRR